MTKMLQLISRDMRQIGRLIIFDDVTDRAELEHRLVQADKLSSIGLLAAGVAHEVNTPLAVISTYAQMLAKQVAEDAQKSMILEKIAKLWTTERVKKVIDDCVQLFGAYGYMTEYPIARAWADVRISRIFGRTSEIMKEIISRSL